MPDKQGNPIGTVWALFVTFSIIVFSYTGCGHLNRIVDLETRMDTMEEIHGPPSEE